MRTASLAALKKELNALHAEELREVVIRLAKYKKENKELLSYLLLGEGNEDEYVASALTDVSEAMQATNPSSVYLAKKSIRRALRIADKHARYSGMPETAIMLHIHFCEEMRRTGIDIKRSKVLLNLYDRVVKRIQTTLATLHEDLQFDYRDRLAALQLR